MRNAAHKAWADYDARVRKAFVSTPSALAFEQKKMAHGVLTLPLDAEGIVGDSDQMLFSWTMCQPGYQTIRFSEAAERHMNASSLHRRIDGPLRGLMLDCVAQLKWPVSERLGTYWRILNVRVWTTPPESAHEGMYKFHKDGFPPAIFKVMIYFTPMDRDHGTLEIVDGSSKTALIGPAGSWVLFYNSAIEHRGLPGTKRERASAEITLARSNLFDLELHQPGLNAHWPLVP